MATEETRYVDRALFLEALGFTEVRDLMSDPPVQLTGYIEPKHKWFYFRARSGGASLEVYDRNPWVERRSPEPNWEGRVDCDEPEPEDDCYLNHEVVVGLVELLVKEWRSGRPSFNDWTDE